MVNDDNLVTRLASRFFKSLGKKVSESQRQQIYNSIIQSFTILRR